MEIFKVNSLPKEEQIKYLKTFSIPRSIKDIEFIRENAEKLNLLDDQDYINYLDQINKLSID